MTPTELKAFIKSAVADALRAHTQKQAGQIVAIQKGIATIQANDRAHQARTPAAAAAPSTAQAVTLVTKIAQAPGTTEAERDRLAEFIIKAQAATGDSRMHPDQVLRSVRGGAVTRLR